MQSQVDDNNAIVVELSEFFSVLEEFTHFEKQPKFFQ